MAPRLDASINGERTLTLMPTIDHALDAPLAAVPESSVGAKDKGGKDQLLGCQWLFAECDEEE